MRSSLLRSPVPRDRSNYLSALLIFLVAILLIAALPLSAAGRVIPDDVAVTAFVKPAGQHLQVLIRVPVIAMNEVQFPVLDGSNFMDIAGAQTMFPGLARYWIADSLDILENDLRLPKPQVVQIRLAASADKSFASFDAALGHFSAPQTQTGMDIYWNQAWFDVQFDYPISSDRSEFSLRPHLAHLGARVATTLTFLAPDGTVRPFEYMGDPDIVRLAPVWTEAASSFFRWGFAGVLGGTDYLLIVCCLVLPLRRVRAAVPVALGFVSAGALTLFASTAGLASDSLWFHPLTQTLLAAAILVAAAQNIAGGVNPARRALEAIVFGLIFGFDFSAGLAAKAQFGGAHSGVATISYGVGGMFSLLLVFAVLPPVLRLLFHFTRVERAETIVLSMLAAHAAWHWMTERWEQLTRFPFNWPVVDTAFLAFAMRWMMILVIFGGVVWFAFGLFKSEDKGAAA